MWGQDDDTIHPSLDPDSPPTSAGKLKKLWDAVRQAKSAPPPPAPSPTAPGDLSGMGGPAVPDLPYTEPPAAHIAAPDPSASPSAARASDLQSQLNKENAPPTIKQRLGRLLPVVAAAGIGAATHSPTAVQGAADFETSQTAQRNIRRATLASQLSQAQTAASQEYQTGQRTTELANAAADAARARRDVAGTNAGARVLSTQITGDSRRDVADTTSDARRDVVKTQGDTARDVQGLRNKGSYAVAMVGANGRIQAAKYQAEAARSRQVAGFDHADTKPTADEDRRADMAKSMDVITDRLDEITQKRPELFGPVAGRVSSLRSKVGTSDEDIAELENIRENLGQIALAAHSMRNAGHIATAANSILNSMNNSPEATRSATKSQRGISGSMNTIVRPTLTGKTAARTPASTSTKANDPLGIR